MNSKLSMITSAHRFEVVRRALVVAAVAALLLPIATAHADVGPKPSMTFTFEYEIAPVDIVSGQLIKCEDATCAVGEPLPELGPQSFACDARSCSSLAYGYADYHKLVITFTDRVRESNVFTKRAFAATYKVIVSETALRVEEASGFLGGGCCPGLAATIALESLIALAYLGLFRLPKVILGWVPLASILTLPVVWLLFPQLGLPAGWTVGLAEAFAVLAEAALLYLVTRGIAPLKHVLTLSLVMNAASFAAGLFLAL